VQFVALLFPKSASEFSDGSVGLYDSFLIVRVGDNSECIYTFSEYDY